jgi:hypothetical protein
MRLSFETENNGTFLTPIKTGSDRNARRVRASFADLWCLWGRPNLHLDGSKDRRPRTLVRIGGRWYSRVVVSQ